MKFILTILIIFSSVLTAFAESEKEKRISYDEFIDAVSEGRVQSVRFWGISAIGGNMDIGSRTVRFITAKTVTSENDPLLMRYLEAHAVPVDIEAKPDEIDAKTGFTLASVLISPLNFMITVTLLCMMIYQITLIKKLQKRTNRVGGGN